MKKAIILISFMIFFIGSKAQLKVKAKCDDFTVDILNGRVNGVRPDFTMGQIQEKLPCATSVEERPNVKCGRSVFYQDRDIYFYVDRAYVEIGPKFKGKLSIPLMGAQRSSLFKWLGRPKLKDDNWDAFEVQYGTLVLHYDKLNRVILIQFSTKGTDVLNLCE